MSAGVGGSMSGALAGRGAAASGTSTATQGAASSGSRPSLRASAEDSFDGFDGFDTLGGGPIPAQTTASAGSDPFASLTNLSIK